jgi:hypothetical protein
VEGGSLLAQALKNAGWRGARQTGRSAKTSFLIVDAQSVKNTDTAVHKGYDEDKKISGIKRHIAVDAVAGATAEVTDRKGALQALDRCKPILERVESLLCDSGYVGQPFAQGVRDILGKHVTVRIAKRSEIAHLQGNTKALGR